jgi:hypothetical protein
VKQPYPCRSLAFNKKTIAMDLLVPFLKKGLKSRRQGVPLSGPWLCDCVQPYYWRHLLFSTERNICTSDGVSDITLLFVLRHELPVNYEII